LTKAVERAAADLRSGRPLDKQDSVDMRTFEEILELKHWQNIERQYDV
jgi:hypothetical protein